LALQLAQDGAKLVLAARNTQALQNTTDQIQQINPNVLTIPTDATQPEQVQNLIQTSINHFGVIDYLFSNAGQYQRSRIVDMNIEILQQSMEVNFYSHIYLTLTVLPLMLHRKQGHIIFVSSMDAKKGLPA